MLLICITHASARSVEPRYILRSLTEAGRDEVKQAAAEFRKAIPKISPALDKKNLLIGKIVTSPMARCVETILLFADELKDLTKTSEILVSAQLKEARGSHLKY